MATDTASAETPAEAPEPATEAPADVAPAPAEATEPASQYDPERHYKVQLSKIVEWHGDLLSPGKETELRGDVVEALKDCISHVEPL